MVGEAKLVADFKSRQEAAPEVEEAKLAAE